MCVCVCPQDGLCSVFSSFGPLYLLKVFPNAPLSPPGFYGLIKFYSAAQASRAQRRTDGRSLFQNSPLKVAHRHTHRHTHAFNPVTLFFFCGLSGQLSFLFISNLNCHVTLQNKLQEQNSSFRVKKTSNFIYTTCFFM